MKCLLFFTQLPLIFLLIANLSDAARILVLLPIASHSHKTVFDPLIKALALNDHDLTVVSPVASRGLPISVKEIHPATLDELGYGFGKDLLETRKQEKATNHFLPTLWNTSLVDHGCHKLYQDVEIKYLMRGLKKFDLAIVSGLHNECALGLVSLFKVSHIYLTTMPAPNYVLGRFGHYVPTSFVPSPFTVFDEDMTFVERCANFLTEASLVLFANFYLFPHYEDIYRQYLGEDTPSIAEIDSVGVIGLMNSNPIMSHKRPLPPNLIEIGCLHCRIAHSLPTELDKFLNEAEDGFIYFSLGSMISPEDMPQHVLNLFVKVFSNLEQRVLWKWDEDIPKLTTNIKVEHWLPQQDILGHGNIKLFISNGGIQSTQEAIFHGVPILGIPLTGEHDLNMKQAERKGFARTWEILDLNATHLEELIDEMLIEPEYQARAKHFSRTYRELPDVALQKALYWTEYVIRNKGAPNLRPSSMDLNYFQYHSFDVIMFLTTLLLLTSYTLYCFMISRFTKPTKSVPVDPRNGSTSNKSE